MRSAPLSGHPAIPSSLCGGRQQVLLCVYFTPPKRSRELFHVVQFCSALIDRWGGGSTESACSSSPSPPASSVSHRYVNVFKTRGRPIRRNRVRSHRLVYCAGGFCSGSAASPSFGRSVSHGMCYPTHTRVRIPEQRAACVSAGTSQWGMLVSVCDGAVSQLLEHFITQRFSPSRCVRTVQLKLLASLLRDKC